VDENGNLSPQNPLPAVTLDDNPDITTIGVPSADPNNACYHYQVDFNTQGNVTFTATDNTLTATATTEIIDYPCVLISEVIDPTSGNNKYVEIFNGSSNPIDISNYKVKYISQWLYNHRQYVFSLARHHIATRIYLCI
jgi:hypothetical protein